VVLSPIKKEKMLAIKENPRSRKILGFLEGFGFLLRFVPRSRKILCRIKKNASASNNGLEPWG
jgi:hypothetical protein